MTWKSQLLIDEQSNERTANREQYNTNKLAWKPQLRFRSHTIQRRAVQEWILEVGLQSRTTINKSAQSKSSQE
jgi:hypothetical protein